MNHSEIFTISINGIAVVFFGLLALHSCKTAKSLEPIIRVMKPNATPSPIMEGEVTIMNEETKEEIKIEAAFTRISQAIRQLSLGSFVGFIVSLAVLIAQFYY